MSETLKISDFVLRQKNCATPLEIWVDLLINDDVSMARSNTFEASLNGSALRVKTSPHFTRQIELDQESQTLLKTCGGVMVFCGPSGVIAQGALTIV